MCTATVIQSHATFGFCLSGLFRPKLLLVRPGPHRTIKRMLVFDFLQAERPSVTEVTSHTTAFTAIFQLRLGHPSITYKKVFGHHWITFLVTFLSPHASLAVKAGRSIKQLQHLQGRAAYQSRRRQDKRGFWDDREVRTSIRWDVSKWDRSTTCQRRRRGFGPLPAVTVLYHISYSFNKLWQNAK